MQKAESHIKYTLAKHSDINWCNFGTSLWKQATLPALAHAAGVWFNETQAAKDTLNTIQYACAKAVLKLHDNPARVAILAEMGWLPILEELNIARANYIRYISKLEPTRLVRKIFYCLWDLYNRNIHTEFPYFRNIAKMFSSWGRDYMLYNHFDMKTVKSAVKETVAGRNQHAFRNMESLHLYSQLKSDDGPSSFLLSKKPFHAIKLKLKLRMGSSVVGADLHRQHRGNGLCMSCNNFETAKHLVMTCSAYSEERAKLYRALKYNLDEEMFSFLLQYPEHIFTHLMGDHDDIFNDIFLDFLGEIWKKRMDKS